MARVDLESDHAAGRLRVLAAYAEEGTDRARIAGELADELELMAGWLELEEIEVCRRGDLAAALRRAV